jgi:hypothetical protein
MELGSSFLFLQEQIKDIIIIIIVLNYHAFGVLVWRRCLGMG